MSNERTENVEVTIKLEGREVSVRCTVPFAVAVVPMPNSDSVVRYAFDAALAELRRGWIRDAGGVPGTNRSQLLLTESALWRGGVLLIDGCAIARIPGVEEGNDTYPIGVWFGALDVDRRPVGEPDETTNSFLHAIEIAEARGRATDLLEPKTPPE